MGILREDYKNQCALFAHTLSSQSKSSDASYELIKRGKIRIENHVAAAFNDTTTAIIRICRA